MMSKLVNMMFKLVNMMSNFGKFRYFLWSIGMIFGETVVGLDDLDGPVVNVVFAIWKWLWVWLLHSICLCFALWPTWLQKPSFILCSGHLIGTNQSLHSLCLRQARDCNEPCQGFRALLPEFWRYGGVVYIVECHVELFSRFTTTRWGIYHPVPCHLLIGMQD